MITPNPNNAEFENHRRFKQDVSCSKSSIAEIQFWMDNPVLDDLTAAQSEGDRQQVRRDVEECIRLLESQNCKVDSHGNSCESPPKQSRYAFQRVLGVGAFGVVLHARDRTLSRDVAIKILRPSALFSKEARARFTIEGEALARCSCPGIVPIYEVGSLDGHPYIAMGLVQGETLADFVKAQVVPVPPTLSCRIVVEIANAVHQAHQRGILHRDLKPSNVLLEQVQGSRSNLPFIPFVSDFGLAKDLLPDADKTRSHSTVDSPIIGTVRYMSPEQAMGRSQDVSVTSDVFSLGVILYELLTLKSPFHGTTTFEIIQQVATTAPQSPRQLNPKVTRELNAIVARCLSKAPTDRYRTANELAEDLQRLLDGKPVSAKPVGPMRATYYWAMRNPSLAIATLIIWCGLIVSTGTIAILYRENLKNLTNAISATQREDAARRFALELNDQTVRHMAEKTLLNVPQTQQKKLELHLMSLKANERYAKLRGYDDESMYRLHVSHHYVANDAFNCQQFDLSTFHRRRCLEIVGALAEKDPRNGEYQFDIFMNRFLMPNNKMTSEGHLAWLLKTREHLSSAIKLSSYNPAYEEADAGICVLIGHVVIDCRQGDPREWFAIAIEKIHELGRKYPDRPHYYKHAIAGHHGMIRVDIKEEKWDSIREHCHQSLDIIEKHFKYSSDVADILTHKLTTLSYYSLALSHIDKVQAIEAHEQLILEALKIEPLEPRFEYFRIHRANAFLGQAKLYRELGNAAFSKTSLEKAIQALVNYKPAIPTDADFLAKVQAEIAEFEKLSLDPSGT